MKKTLALALTTVICASGLAACGNKTDITPQSDVQSVPQTRTEQTAPDTVLPSRPQRRNLEITIDGIDGLLRSRSDIRGVTRTFTPSFAGTYTVEYIHVPYGIDRDDTLDYRIEINADNTYTMTVVSNGVRSEHEGRWYSHRDCITFFYDEQIDTPEHNVYVADSLYAERLPHNKIMIYDNCHTLVLSRSDETVPDIAEQRLQRAQNDNGDTSNYRI